MKTMLKHALRPMLLLLIISVMIPQVEGRPTGDCTCGAERQMPLLTLSDADIHGDTDDNFQRLRFGRPMQVAHLYIAQPYDETVCRLRIAPSALAVNAAICAALAISFQLWRERRKRRVLRFMYGNERY